MLLHLQKRRTSLLNYFSEVAPNLPVRLPNINKTDKVLFACHGRKYRIQDNKNIYTLDVFSGALPDFKISLKSRNLPLVLSKYENYFDKIYMLYCPIPAFLIKRKHYIPNKLVFNNLKFLLKINGQIILNNFALFVKNNTKKFNTGEYFLSYLDGPPIAKETSEKLILRKL
jgi:hypothetical protein